MSKNVDIANYKYCGYGIRFDTHGICRLSDSSWFGQNVIIFGADMSSYAHVDNRKKYILILGKDRKQWLDDTILFAEKEFTINFSEQQKKNLSNFTLLRSE